MSEDFESFFLENEEEGEGQDISQSEKEALLESLKVKSNQIFIPFDGLVKEVVHHVKQNYDFIISVNGNKGDGKSTLAYQFAKKADKHFNLARNFIYNGSDYSEFEGKIKNLPQYTPVVVDEAIESLYSQEWNTTLQRNLSKLFTTSRKQNKIVLLCMPFFTDLNAGFRNKLVDLWVQVLGRGVAVVFRRDENIFNADKWNFEFMQKLLSKRGKAGSRSRFLTTNILQNINYLRWNYPNFVGVTTFEQLSEEEEKNYLNFVNDTGKFEFDLYDGSVKTKELKQSLGRAVAWLYKSGADVKKLSEKLNLSVYSVRGLLKREGVDLRRKGKLEVWERAENYMKGGLE